MDDGYLTGDSAGVIGIYVMHEGNENGEGRFSLGPLNCTGDGNGSTIYSWLTTSVIAHASTEISFINTQAFLITEPWRNGNFEFEFRTSEERSQLLTAETAESTNMRLELKEGTPDSYVTQNLHTQDISSEYNTRHPMDQ